MSESPQATGAPRRTAAQLAALVGRGADWGGLRVVVCGIGTSGFAAADTLAELGARVVAVDQDTSGKARERAEVLDVVGPGRVTVQLGAEHLQALPAVDGAVPDLVVTSPGWLPTSPVFTDAAAHGVPVWGDVELAWRLRDFALAPGAEPAEWLCVTGTDGKTTTVEMLASILRAAGLRAQAVGNVGVPVLDAVRDPEGFDVLAVELSSFELHWCQSLEPAASVVLNVAPDHLNWHGSYDAYRDDKAKIYHRARLACVYNVDDPQTRAMVESADVIEGCRAVGFTLGAPAVSELGVVAGPDGARGEAVLCDRAFIPERADHAQELLTVGDLQAATRSELPVPDHFVANALAAAALARAAGVTPAAVRAGLREFRVDPHRIEFVATVDGAHWIDDSKATTTHSTDAALSAFDRVVWIVGGLSKGASYTELVTKHADRLAGAVLIGADRRVLADDLARHAPGVPVLQVDPDDTELVREQAGEGTAGGRPRGAAVIDRAVALAATLAGPGDAVLLAPASASWDQFDNYVIRGELFAQAVRRLAAGRTQGGPGSVGA